MSSSIPSQKKNVEELEPSISFMGMRLTDESVSIESDSIFNMPANENFTPSLEIKNGFDSSQKYRLVFLLNYKPIDFSVDGRDYANFDVNIDANSVRKIDINFPELPTGQHDLTTVIVREPDKVLTEPNYISGYEHILAHRSNIVVSENDFILPEYTKVMTYPETIGLENNIVINQGASNYPVSLLNNDTGDLWLNFESTGKSKYAVVFLDLLQIKTTVDYISIDSKGTVKLPLTLDHLEYPTNVISIAVENPFTNDFVVPYVSNKISLSK